MGKLMVAYRRRTRHPGQNQAEPHRSRTQTRTEPSSKVRKGSKTEGTASGDSGNPKPKSQATPSRGHGPERAAMATRPAPSGEQPGDPEPGARKPGTLRRQRFTDAAAARDSGLAARHTSTAYHAAVAVTVAVDVCEGTGNGRRGRGPTDPGVPVPKLPGVPAALLFSFSHRSMAA
jgi:hypothetical protein